MQLAAMNSDKITILIRLAGGNDGLNTVVPYTNSEYYTLRQSGEIFIKQEEVLPLKGSSTMGLHPALAPLQTLYNENKVAIIQNVGYPNQNFRISDLQIFGFLELMQMYMNQVVGMDDFLKKHTQIIQKFYQKIHLPLN